MENMRRQKHLAESRTVSIFHDLNAHATYNQTLCSTAPFFGSSNAGQICAWGPVVPLDNQSPAYPSPTSYRSSYVGARHVVSREYAGLEGSELNTRSTSVSMHRPAKAAVGTFDRSLGSLSCIKNLFQKHAAAMAG